LVSNETRDFYLLIATIFYLEKFENYTIEFEFIWNAHKIKTAKPDLVILPNERGNNLYYEVAQYCKTNDILVLSHDSEGNFNTQIDYDFWGLNLSKKLVCPILYTWNQRVKDYLLSKYEIPEQNCCVSGAPGFDKYKYLPKINKATILAKYGKGNYNKIVGYAGWAFGKIYNAEIKDLTNYLNMSVTEGTKWLAEQRDKVEECLETVIQKYPDILFILKKHPRENFESDYKDSRNEMNRLVRYDNVLYLKDEEVIQDLIQISDLWMAFESTSIMEAWLMDVPTLMINPVTDFNRLDFYTGSASVTNSAEILSVFSDFFEKNQIETLTAPEIIAKRNEIISQSIGFADGFNHLRVNKAFKPFLQKRAAQKIGINWKFLRLFLLLHLGKYFYNKQLFERLPKFKKTIWVFENYKLEKIKLLKTKTYSDLENFYHEKGLLSKQAVDALIDKL